MQGNHVGKDSAGSSSDDDVQAKGASPAAHRQSPLQPHTVSTVVGEAAEGSPTMGPGRCNEVVRGDSSRPAEKDRQAPQREGAPWERIEQQDLAKLDFPVGLQLGPCRRGCFLELFCGSGQLSAAIKQHTGAMVLPGVDLSFGPWKIDLSQDPHVRLIKSWLRSGDIRYVHMGTPCTSFSQALRGDARKRSFDSPEGPKGDPAIELANKLVEVSCEIAELASQLGIGWSIENPAGSLLWRMPCVQRLFRLGVMTWFDQCQYGGVLPGQTAPFRKRTRLLSNVVALQDLAKKCGGGHMHDRLVGSFFNPEQQCWCVKTKVAGAYPRQLCRRWSALVAPLFEAPRREFAELKLKMLLWPGDMKPHSEPQPRGRGMPGRGVQDLLLT